MNGEEGRGKDPPALYMQHPLLDRLKNGGNVRFQRGFATLLQDGDHLAILPPVGGG